MAFFAYFVTLILVFIILPILLKNYWNYKKKISNFPFYNLLPYVVYCYIFGKISKNTPVNNVIFEKLIQLGYQHMKEGYFMTYFSQPALFIYSEDAIKFFSNEKAALDKSPEYKFFEDILKEGIVISNGERWKKHRKLINPSFHMGMLQDKIHLFNEHAMNLVIDMEKMVGKPCVDIDGTLKVHYFNALCESVLGLKQDKENEARLLKLLKYVDNLAIMTVQRVSCPWLRPKFMLKLFPFGRKYLRQNKECDDFIDEIILDMKKSVYSNNNDIEKFGKHLRKSLTYILINQHLRDPTFTLGDVHAEVRNIIGAGYDSVSLSSLWCLYLLGLHPEVQEKVYNEVLTTAGNFVTYEETTNLTYLEAVIMESLRIFPTFPVFLRDLSEDVQYGKLKVLKGTSIAFFAYLSHRNPKIYPDPDEFKPERFLDLEVKKSCTFIPFSEGKRSCFGKNYALLEMKIFLSHILRNFKITSLDRREDMKFNWAVILLPVKHLSFKIEKR